MQELREKVEFLEKTLFEYIERDKLRLLEDNEVLKKELRTARSTIAKMQKELRDKEEKRKNIAEKMKQTLKSE